MNKNWLNGALVGALGMAVASLALDCREYRKALKSIGEAENAARQQRSEQLANAIFGGITDPKGAEDPSTEWKV